MPSGKPPADHQRQLRKERYKRLLDDGCLIGETAETADILATLRDVQHILEQSNRIVADGDLKERVENTSEVVLDAQVMKMSHELLGSAVQTIDGGEFGDDEFALAIRQLVTGGGGGETQSTAASSCAAGWQRLTELVAPLCRSFRWSQGMLGTFDADSALVAPAAKQRAQRQPRSQATQQLQTRPEAVGVLRAEEKPAQVLNVILKQLLLVFEANGQQKIPYYAAVVDPGSFMHTVDNCFQVAFLFRDGHLFLDVDEGGDGLPQLGPVGKEQREGGEFAEMKQMVSSMDPRLWRAMIDRYQLTEPMLKVNRDEILNQSQQQPAASQVSPSGSQADPASRSTLDASSSQQTQQSQSKRRAGRPARNP